MSSASPLFSLKDFGQEFQEEVRQAHLCGAELSESASLMLSSASGVTTSKGLSGYARAKDRWNDQSLTLVWRVGLDVWEASWIRQLFLPRCSREIFDLDRSYAPTDSTVGLNILFVDNQLDRSKYEGYRQLALAGARMGLIHLSDEHFTDDLSTYACCETVFRNYWSPLFTAFPDIVAFPLGCKAGFSAGGAVKPAKDRPLKWSFAGNVDKTSRPAMISAMSNTKPNLLHAADGYSSSGALDTQEYRRLMEDSIFVPCPKGNSNFDSFRVYEALDAGCIPIVERSLSFDYFKSFLGDHPMITVSDWWDAPALVEHLCSGDDLPRRQRSCMMWWQNYKLQLALKIGDQMDKTFFGVNNSAESFN